MPVSLRRHAAREGVSSRLIGGAESAGPAVERRGGIRSDGVGARDGLQVLVELLLHLKDLLVAVGDFVLSILGLLFGGGKLLLDLGETLLGRAQLLLGGLLLLDQ